MKIIFKQAVRTKQGTEKYRYEHTKSFLKTIGSLRHSKYGPFKRSA